MARYEYKVVPAPKKGVRAKGVRDAEGRFAHALAGLMNELGAEGWEYQRTDTLPCEERQGLTQKTTVFKTMLVFRRAVTDPLDGFEPKRLEETLRAEPLKIAPPRSADPDEATAEADAAMAGEDFFSPEGVSETRPRLYDALATRAEQKKGGEDQDHAAE